MEGEEKWNPPISSRTSSQSANLEPKTHVQLDKRIHEILGYGSPVELVYHAAVGFAVLLLVQKGSLDHKVFRRLRDDCWERYPKALPFSQDVRGST